MEEQFFCPFQILLLLLYFMVVFFMSHISVVIFNDEVRVYGFSSYLVKLPLADGPEYQWYAIFVSSTFYSYIPSDLRHNKLFFHNIIEHMWYS
jgi:hypothetical protein